MKFIKKYLLSSVILIFSGLFCFGQRTISKVDQVAIRKLLGSEFVVSFPKNSTAIAVRPNDTRSAFARKSGWLADWCLYNCTQQGPGSQTNNDANARNNNSHAVGNTTSNKGMVSFGNELEVRLGQERMERFERLIQKYDANFKVSLQKN